MQGNRSGRATGHVLKVARQRGDQWYAKYRLPDGRQVQKRLGPAWPERGGARPDGFFTRRSAEAELRRILVDAERGTLAAAFAPSSGRTFGDATAEWLRYVEHDRGRRASTLHDYALVAGKLEAEFGADTALARVTTQRVEQYRDRLLAEGRVGRRSVQKTMVLLGGVMARAKRRGWIAVNPCADVESVSVPRPTEFNVLDPVQVEAVARAAVDPQMAELIRVAAYTGLRMGELRALRWRDVDFAGANLHVRRSHERRGGEGPTKSGKARSVPLSSRAARALDALSRRERWTGVDDLVFVNDVGGPVSGDRMRDAFYAALDAAGLGHLRRKADPIRFHDLRHTFGTLMVRGFPVSDVQAMMGHAEVSTTMRYVHHVPRHDAAARMDALMGDGAGDGVPIGVPNGDDSGVLRRT